MSQNPAASVFNRLLPKAMLVAVAGLTPQAVLADVFAAETPLNRTVGLQTNRLIYFYDDGATDFYTTPGANGYPSRYAETVAKMNLMRQFLAVQSGGQFDFKMSYYQVEITSGLTYGANASTFPGTGNNIPILADNAPALNASYSDFQYHFNIIGDAHSINYPSDSEASAAGMGGGDNFWSRDLDAAVTYHEFGHSLGSPHNGSIFQTPTSPGYNYNFTTGQYTAASMAVSDGAWNQPLANLSIGTGTEDGGNPYNRMAGASPGTYDTLTKGTFGWLKAKHFAKISNAVTVGPTGNTAVIRLYDASDLALATKGTGDNIRYGVTQGYQDVAYDASLTRIAEIFDPATGLWKPMKQRFDFYYQGEDSHYRSTYPGYDPSSTQPHGIVVELNHRYVGTLQAGQIIDERTLDMLLANMDPAAYMAQKQGDPRDPSRFRPVHYELNFLNENNKDDPRGVYANLQIKSLFDIKLEGRQWDTSASGGASADGSGTWLNTGGGWRKLAFDTSGNSVTTRDQTWSDGGDAVFGANSGTAGVVTLGDNIAVTSLTFAPVASGKYTIAQDAGNAYSLTLGAWGVVAAESAELACKVTFGADQYWNIVDNKTLGLSGAVTTGGFNLIKFGRGTLELSGANTWDKVLNVAEGTVKQTASQTIGGGGELAIDSGTSYQISGGALTLNSGAKVTGRETYATAGSGWTGSPGFHGDGVLRLSRIDSSNTDAEIRFIGDGEISADMVLDGGAPGPSLQHVIRTSDAYYVPKVSGNISGDGGITLYAGSTSSWSRLELSGANTFTGDLEIQRGSLHLTGANALRGNNVLRFNNAGGDTGRFYLDGYDRSVRDLESAGPGSAIIANARGDNGPGGARAATLTVTQNNDGVYSGAIVDTSNDALGTGAAGALSLVKKGDATLTLSGQNTYTGGTAIEAGTLRVKSADNLGTGTVRLKGGTLSIDQGQGLTRTAFAGTAIDFSAVSGGKFTTDLSALNNKTGNVVPASTTYAYTGKIYLTAGQWSFGENYETNARLLINGTQIFNDSSWSNAAKGAITIAADGWYDIDLRVYRSTGNFGPYSGLAGWVGKGIGIKQGGVSSNGADYSVFGPGALGIKLKDRMNIGNDIAVDSDSVLEILDTESAADVHLTGAMSGAGALTKTGAGLVTFEGANTRTGATRVSAGTIAAGAVNVLGAASAYTLDNTTGVALALNGYDQTLGSLAGGGSAGGDIALGGATLTVGGDNTNTAYSGRITGTGGLRKLGTGTLKFDFANAGVTSDILASTTAVTLGGGTLEWSGKLNTQNTQTLNGVTLLANTRSTLKLTQNDATSLDLRLGNITTASGATLDFQGGTSDDTGSPTQGARFSFTTVNGNNIATDARLGDFATWNGTDWAANSGISDNAGGYYIRAYNGYTNIYNGTAIGSTAIQQGAANDVRINEAAGPADNTLGATTVTINSLLMSAAGHAAAVDMTGGSLIVGDGANASGGIAVGAGARGLTLGTAPNQGRLTSGTSGVSTLGLISNNASPADGLVVNAKIVDAKTVSAGTGTTGLLVSGGTGGGTVVLAGDNTFTGDIRVVSGAKLQIGAGGATGTLGGAGGVFGAVSLDSGTTLAFNRSDAGFVVANAISGAGGLVQSGSGTTTLTGANSYSGATIVSAGILRIGDGGSAGTLGSGGVSIASGTSLVFNRSDAGYAVANAISGDGTLTQAGTGKTILTGANDYTGGTVIAAGTLQIGNGGATGSFGSGAVSGSGTLAFNRSDSIVVTNAITGSVSLAQNGPATLVLTGANNYSGTTTIVSDGTLQIGNGGTAGTIGTGAVNNGGTLAFYRTDDLTVTAAVSGAGALIQEGSGRTILTGANDYTGTTLVNDGTLQVGDGHTTGKLGTGLVTLYGTLAFNRSDKLTVGNTFTGTGAITQAGTGTTVIASDNDTYTGTVTIASGTLQLGDGSTTGSMRSATFVNNGTLAFNRSDAVQAGPITGTGGLTQMGSGTLILTGNNSYQGVTTINANTTLQVGNGGNGGTLGAGNTIVNGTLQFNRNNTLTVTSAISGSGDVIQNGTGTLVLGAANTYAGTTTVNAGTLRLSSTSATLGQGDLIVKTGGTFSFSGPDSSNYALANRVSLDGGTVSANGWFSNLTLNGSLSVGSGGGTLTTNTPDPYNGGNINLNGVVSGSGALSLQSNNSTYGVGKVWFNNADNSYSGTITAEGVSGKPLLGIGSSTALRYATLNLAPSTAAKADTDQVAYAAGVNAATVAGLTGNAWGGMKLQNGSTAVALTVNNAADNTFAGVLSGTGSMTKTGAGALTLSGQNTYTGGTGVSAGMLALDFSAGGAPATNILSSAGLVSLNGGTLRIIGKAGANGVVQTFAGLTGGAGDSTFELVRTASGTFDVDVGTLSFGAGKINFVGLTGKDAGARVITSTNAGANDATTQLSATSALWNGTDWASVERVSNVNYLVKWTGTYTDLLTNSNATNATGNLRINNGAAGTAANYTTDTTVASLLMIATNNTTTIGIDAGKTLTVGASATGNIAIASDARSLTIGQTAGQGTLTAGTAGAASLNLSNGSTAATLTVNANIADNGSSGGVVSLTAAGNVVLNGGLTYTGATTVSAGSILTVRNLLNGGNYAANILNNGTLNLNASGVQNFSGVLSGAGTTTVGNGTLQLGRSDTLAGGAVNITPGAAIDLNGYNTGTATVTLGGTNTLLNSSATRGSVLKLTLSGDTALNNTNDILIGSTTGTNGVLSLAGHTLTLNGTGTVVLNGATASDSGNIIINAGTLRFIDYSAGERATTLSGAGTITINSGGKLDTTHWASAFTLSKDIVLNGGAITSNWPGPNGATYASNILVQSASAINVGGSYGNATFSGVISGGGALSVGGGGGTRTFTGDSSFTGNLTVAGDTLILGGSGRIGSGNYGGSLNLSTTGATFSHASTAAQTISGAITGLGKLTKSNTGTLKLSGNNSFSGGTTLTAGTLVTAHTAALGSGSVSVANGATLQLGDSGANGAVILGAGATLALATDATLKLGATNANIAMGAGGVFTLADGFNLDITGQNFGAGLTLGQSSKYTLVTGSGTGNSMGEWIAGTDLLGGKLAEYGYALALENNNLVLTVTAVPEPSTYGLIGAGALAAAALARRRRKTGETK